MTTWAAILGVGVGSYVLRAVPLLVLGRMQLSPRANELIGRAGLAAITALIVLSTQSAASGRPAPAALAAVAAVGAGLVLASRKASMLHVVALGGVMYAVVRLSLTVWG